MSGGSDPLRIDSLAVHTDDVLTAFEARERGRRHTVLRVLPPFSARMRARIHVVDGTGQEGGALHLHPGCFVGDCPPYPTVDDTADDLRAHGEYTVETHREAHAKAVEDWRDTVRSRLTESIELSLHGTASADERSGDQERHSTLRVRYLG